MNFNQLTASLRTIAAKLMDKRPQPGETWIPVAISQDASRIAFAIPMEILETSVKCKIFYKTNLPAEIMKLPMDEFLASFQWIAGEGGF